MNNAKDARELVTEYHNQQSDEELKTCLKNIAVAAKLGKYVFLIYFDYEKKNVARLKDLGFKLMVRKKDHIDGNEPRHITYYDITWKEEV